MRTEINSSRIFFFLFFAEKSLVLDFNSLWALFLFRSMRKLYFIAFVCGLLDIFIACRTANRTGISFYSRLAHWLDCVLYAMNACCFIFYLRLLLLWLLCEYDGGCLAVYWCRRIDEIKIHFVEWFDTFLIWLSTVLSPMNAISATILCFYYIFLWNNRLFIGFDKMKVVPIV